MKQVMSILYKPKTYQSDSFSMLHCFSKNLGVEGHATAKKRHMLLPNLDLDPPSLKFGYLLNGLSIKFLPIYCQVSLQLRNVHISVKSDLSP